MAVAGGLLLACARALILPLELGRLLAFVDHQVLHVEFLCRKDLLDGAFGPLLLLGLVGELEQCLLEVLVIPAALDVVEEGNIKCGRNHQNFQQALFQFVN